MGLTVIAHELPSLIGEDYVSREASQRKTKKWRPLKWKIR